MTANGKAVSRRDLLKAGAAGAALLGLGGRTALSTAASAGNGAPNIIVILVDDMGFSDIGCYGGEIPTPNIDSLADRGVRFTRFYNSARCAPTRASIMTGLHPHQADHAGNRGILPENVVTVPECLRDLGYQTYMTGKWHLNSVQREVDGKQKLVFAEGSRPLDRGFDRFYGAMEGWNPYTAPQAEKFIYEGNEQLQSLPSDWYCTTAFTDKALEFVERGDSGKPFFLYLAYNAPHWPLQAPEELIRKYLPLYESGWDVMRENRFRRQKEMEMFPADLPLSPRDEQIVAWEEALVNNDWWDPLLNPPWQKEQKPVPEEFRNPQTNKADWVRRMATYAAVMELVDRNVGRLVNGLRQRGELDNTLIMFLSDNGACPEGGRSPNYYGTYLYPWACASNTPYRKYKSRVHEGGIITPFIASWPAALPAGAWNHARIAQTKDILPTLLEAAGGSYPRQFGGHAIQSVEGRSFLRACADPEQVDNEAVHFWEHAGNCAVREGRWKALYDTGWVPMDMDVERRWYLYDLESDPFETHDLAAQRPKVLSELVERYRGWAGRVGAHSPG